MSIDCAFHGFVATDAEAKTSKAGKGWTRLRVGVGQGDEIQWVSVAVFGKDAEAAGALKKSDRVYVEGTVRLDSWTGNDGVERTGLSVAAWKVEQTHQIGNAKPPRERKPRAESASKPNDFHNDDIPF
jgi:single-strand DNA-binding protein